MLVWEMGPKKSKGKVHNWKAKKKGGYSEQQPKHRIKKKKSTSKLGRLGLTDTLTQVFHKRHVILVGGGEKKSKM